VTSILHYCSDLATLLTSHCVCAFIYLAYISYNKIYIKHVKVSRFMNLNDLLLFLYRKLYKMFNARNFICKYAIHRKHYHWVQSKRHRLWFSSKTCCCYLTKTHINSVILILKLNLTSLRNIYIKMCVVLNEVKFNLWRFDCTQWDLCTFNIIVMTLLFICRRPCTLQQLASEVHLRCGIMLEKSRKPP